VARAAPWYGKAGQRRRPPRSPSRRSPIATEGHAPEVGDGADRSPPARCDARFARPPGPPRRPATGAPRGSRPRRGPHGAPPAGRPGPARHRPRAGGRASSPRRRPAPRVGAVGNDFARCPNGRRRRPRARRRPGAKGRAGHESPFVVSSSSRPPAPAAGPASDRRHETDPIEGSVGVALRPPERARRAPTAGPATGPSRPPRRTLAGVGGPGGSHRISTIAGLAEGRSVRDDVPAPPRAFRGRLPRARGPAGVVGRGRRERERARAARAASHGGGAPASRARGSQVGKPNAFQNASSSARRKSGQDVRRAELDLIRRVPPDRGLPGLWPGGPRSRPTSKSWVDYEGRSGIFVSALSVRARRRAPGRLPVVMTKSAGATGRAFRWQPPALGPRSGGVSAVCASTPDAGSGRAGLPQVDGPRGQRRFSEVEREGL
jgi:hypothetical protein